MKFNVHIISDAEEDLLDIYRYVALNDSPEKANRLIDNLEEACMKLETMPERGHIPPELERIGIFDYRELHFKPYRIIYQIIDIEKELNVLLEKGFYKSREDLIDDAYRALLRSRPHLRIEAAVSLYEKEEVSLAKASEIAGVCIEEFKETLRDKGLSVKVPSISKEELDEQTKLILKLSK